MRAAREALERQKSEKSASSNVDKILERLLQPTQSTIIRLTRDEIWRRKYHFVALRYSFVFPPRCASKSKIRLKRTGHRNKKCPLLNLLNILYIFFNPIFFPRMRLLLSKRRFNHSKLLNHKRRQLRISPIKTSSFKVVE